MAILLAFDKYKDALGAADAVDIAAATIQSLRPSASCERVPLTDGGEGFAQIIANAMGGKLHAAAVHGPRFEKTTGRFAMIAGDSIPQAAFSILQLPGHCAGAPVAFVEMASASGLELLVPAQRDPWLTSTYGTGELIHAAIEAGAGAIVLGIGGSATNDCGAGALEALGTVYYDRELQPVRHVTPAGFKHIHTLGGISHQQNRYPPLRIACDVNNPLLGEQGATRVYGPQKGLAAADVDHLERLMGKMGRRILGLFGKDPAGWENHLAEAGSGAAGGIGFALRHAFSDSRFVSGFALVEQLLQLPQKLANADILLTGEGRVDASSLAGKGPLALLSAAPPTCRNHLLVGSIDPSTRQHLAHALPSLTIHVLSPESWSLETALARTPETLSDAVKQIFAQ